MFSRQMEELNTMLNVVSVDNTNDIIRENFSGYQLETEKIDIELAAGRIISSDVLAQEDIPGFVRSSVDGYAVISSDTFGASESMPVQLRIIGSVRMGEKPEFSFATGQAVYVPTGGEIPAYADSMVMVEYTEDFGDGFINIHKSSAPGNHLVFKGDDVRQGDTVIRANTRLRPQDVGILAAMGHTKVIVKQKIRVGIISTGDEIIPVEQQPSGSQVRDINSYALSAGVSLCGAQPLMCGIVGDNFNDIRRAVEDALRTSDIVLISGGSSAGAKDETRKVIESLGTPGVLVHGIAVKPGKPTIVGRIVAKAVVGLPGHPASAYSIFHQFVRQIINVMNGLDHEWQPVIKAEMAGNYPSNSGREEFVPVELKYDSGKPIAHPVFSKSGLITLLTKATGYIHIDRGSEGLDKGHSVDVHLY
jgi:molybdopterin molybdotransferase